MNKNRPEGTRRVSNQEKTDMLRELYARKKDLEDQMTSMSVTLYTQKAKNKQKGLVERLNEIDESISILKRGFCLVN